METTCTHARISLGSQLRAALTVLIQEETLQEWEIVSTRDGRQAYMLLWSDDPSETLHAGELADKLNHRFGFEIRMGKRP